MWSTLPIFLPIHLHGSLQSTMSCTSNIYIYIYIHSHLLNYMSVLTIIFHMQVHLHADLVYHPYPFIHSTISLVNKLETPTHTHTHTHTHKDTHTYTYIYIYIYIYMLRLANNGNIKLATNIYRLMWSTGKRLAVSMTSLVCFEIKPLDPH